MKFHSPYQFINIKKCEYKTDYSGLEQLKKPGNAYVRHDSWDKKGLSGCIRCILTTVTPLVIGANQQKGNQQQPGIVEPYTHRNKIPAIPANSLRGMVANIAETISQSSLRVLASEQNSTYTVRKEVGDPIKEMAVLYKKADEFYLYKLPGNPLKVPVYGDNKKREDVFFIKKARTFQNKDTSSKFIYATQDDDYTVSELSTEANEEKIKGVLYIRGKHINSKKNESFIKWDGRIDESAGINVTQQVETLEKTLRLYQDKETPGKALPKGYNRDWKNDDKAIVQEGDLLYYKQGDEDGQITELSYSQIWRKPVNSNLHLALERIADEDALPWNKNRKQLTPAEAMFGVVEDEPKVDKAARNLASRIQFTDAVAKESITWLPKVTLKILDSPKPPSPAMYFYDENGQHISKKTLDLKEQNPNGRKQYIPQPKASEQSWKTQFTDKNPPENGWQQYLSCTPIPENTEFYFDIHFENLSKEELGLLQTAIQPTVEPGMFYHRLGLGKPLGLGQITQKIETIEIIDRTRRYSLEGLKQERYQQRKQPADQTLIDQDTLDVLKTVYNPQYVTEPVCYPFNSSDGQKPYNESEGFSWFVKNDKFSQQDPKKQKLKIITANKKIPTLDSFS